MKKSTSQEKHNYRKLPRLDSCGTCRFICAGAVQGMYRCRKVGVETYDSKSEHVCDLHELPHVPTPREIALRKLTVEDKKALGL